jgi:hypothetical protein
MRVPREKLRFSSPQGGQNRSKGWIVINLRGMDLEGVNELTLSLEDVEAVAAGNKGDTDEVANLRTLLGG